VERRRAMLIGSGTLSRECLDGQVAVVTGAGGGIGYEAARALVWLGARVVIAEIDNAAGKSAAARIEEELGPRSALFVRTDIGDERDVARLAKKALHSYGKVDIVVNNATVAPMGAVKDLPIEDWDASYSVNLRGPVLLAQAFLPGMLERDYGVFVCVLSFGQAFMGAYETLKAAQGGLMSTLDGELEGTGVIPFSIGPGFVPTETALAAIPRLAEMLGSAAAELYAAVEEYTISVEAAGAGFAAAVANAERYRGREIDSRMALLDAGIDAPSGKEATESSLGEEEFERALALCRAVRATLAEQSDRWLERSRFERQWMINSFKKQAGMPVEQWLDRLERLERCLEAQDSIALSTMNVPLDSLVAFYRFLYKAGEGYLKDPAEREEQLGILRGWQGDAEGLQELLS
jgi:NAD(P)-dependent dehydrogenase (short-subunit alcohol dehydrogenase family)